jgi:hypothetical protein
MTKTDDLENNRARMMGMKFENRGVKSTKREKKRTIDSGKERSAPHRNAATIGCKGDRLQEELASISCPSDQPFHAPAYVLAGTNAKFGCA